MVSIGPGATVSAQRITTIQTAHRPISQPHRGTPKECQAQHHLGPDRARPLTNKDLVDHTPRHLLGTAQHHRNGRSRCVSSVVGCIALVPNRTTLTADINCECTASTCCPSDLALCGDFCSTHPTVWSTSRRRQTTCEVCVDIADSEHCGCTR